MALAESPVKFERGVRRLLRSRLGEIRFQAVYHSLGAFTRILPHTQISKWATDANVSEPGAYWADAQRRRLRIRVILPQRGHPDIPLTSTLERFVVLPLRESPRTLDLREHNICRCIVEIMSDFWREILENPADDLVEAFIRAFDQAAISRHIQDQHDYSPAGLFASLGRLSERSYEGKSIPLGVVVDTNSNSKGGEETEKTSLEDCFSDKKYHVLTDGYDTAYLVDIRGTVVELLDLARPSQRESVRGRRFFPEWSRQMALSCTGARIGVSLTRQGDILYFDNGNLRITYRGGQWQYWNHTHVLNILLHTTRARHVSPQKRHRILHQIYRRALDLSFRRTGGLYILLRNRKFLRKIVRKGDAIGDGGRRRVDEVLDMSLREQSVLGIPSRVLVDIASLDGAVVLANSGRLLAYGAVLDPKKSKGIRGGQGSRTKAAIGASHYGLATKVSSDGEIAFYSAGRKLLSI